MAIAVNVGSFDGHSHRAELQKERCSKIWAAALRPGANNSSLAFCLIRLAVILMMLQSVLSNSSLSSASFSTNPQSA